MQSDLHKIIVSPQPLTADHVKVFMYQILRGEFYVLYSFLARNEHPFKVLTTPMTLSIGYLYTKLLAMYIAELQRIYLVWLKAETLIGSG